MPHQSRYATDPLIRPLLPAYLARLAHHAQNIRTLRDSNQLEELRKIIHQLKGSAASYGYDPISTLCSEIDAQIAATHSLQSSAPILDTLLTYIENIQDLPT